MSLLDTIIDRVLQVVMPKVVDLIRQSNSHGRNGFILGSWDPTDGTVSVVLADTVLPVGNDQVQILTRVPLAVPHTGDQYGPLPDDRVIVHRTQSGWIAYPNHDPFDSIGAPAGERWIVHRNPTTKTIDSFIKLTNDGHTSGDGLGGLKLGFGGLAELETVGGHSIVEDDTAKTITITASDGTKVVVDANTGSILFAGATNTDADALIRKSDLDSALSAQVAQTKSDLAVWAAANLTHGSGASGPTSMTAVTSTGSSKTFSA